MDRETTDRAPTDREPTEREPTTTDAGQRADAASDADARGSRAVEQDGSTKQHGDKLEALIPRDPGGGSTAGP